MECLSPVASIKKIWPRESNKALNNILALLIEKDVQTLVAGLPLGTKQQKTAQCEDIEKFCRRIERRAPLKVHYVDEYLSSVEAEEQSSSRKKPIDDIAAEIILRRFLIANGLLTNINIV